MSKVQTQFASLEKDLLLSITAVLTEVIWIIDYTNNQRLWILSDENKAKYGTPPVGEELEFWEKHVHRDDLEGVKQSFAKALKSPDLFQLKNEYRFLGTNGEYFYIQETVHFTKDSHGYTVKALGVLRDITTEHLQKEHLELLLQNERKLNDELMSRELRLIQTEEELLQVNEQLLANIKELFDRDFIINESQRQAKIGSWSYEIQTGFFYGTEGLETIYHLPRNQLTSLSSFIHLHDANYQHHLTQIFNGFLEGNLKTVETEMKYTTDNQETKWLKFIAYPLENESKLERIIGLVHDITAFKETEVKMKASEEKFAKAFHDNPDMMSIHRESDFLIIDVNTHIESLLGYTREEVIGKFTWELNLFTDLDERKAFYREYDQKGSASIETNFRRKDQSLVYVSYTCKKIILEGVTCGLSVVKDISNRKMAEEKFSKTFELSPDFILVIRERDRCMIEVNSKSFAVTGYHREELIGKNQSEFPVWVNQADRDIFEDQINRNGTASIETLLNGKEKIYYASINSVKMMLWGESHRVAVIRDITDRKNFEQKLLENEARLNATINNTTILVWSIDLNFRLQMFNKPFQEYIHECYGNEVQIGEDTLKFPNSDQYPDVIDYWRTLYKRAFTGETLKSYKKSFGRHFSYSLNPIIENGKVTGASIFAEDITEQFEQEQALSDANKKLGELKLIAIRSAMNPHFIFNALNSIQYFILKNDRQNAVSYLSAFSKLIRGILTNSIHNTVKLSEELSLLEHYVSLERLRFNNMFDYKLVIDPSVDVEQTRIPSMLIQPFVENAILHGLYNRPENGLLQLTIKQIDERLYFEIEDNGIGRKMAGLLRKQNFPKHQSVGSSLTEERLKLMNTDENVSLEIIDLYDDDGEASGTLVRICLQ